MKGWWPRTRTRKGRCDEAARPAWVAQCNTRGLWRGVETAKIFISRPRKSVWESGRRATGPDWPLVGTPTSAASLVRGKKRERWGCRHFFCNRSRRPGEPVRELVRESFACYLVTYDFRGAAPVSKCACPRERETCRSTALQPEDRCDVMGKDSLGKDKTRRHFVGMYSGMRSCVSLGGLGQPGSLLFVMAE